MTPRTVLAGAVLALLAASCTQSASTNPPAERRACPVLTLTGHPSYPPVAWADGSTLEGGGIEVVRRIASAHGVQLKVVNEGTWANAQAAVADGSADAIVGIYKTQARMSFLNYVDPALAPDPSAVVIRAGASFPYANWKSLIGHAGVAGAGESYGAKFDAFAASKLTLERVPALDDVYRAVIDGSAEYGLSGYYAALTGAPKKKIAFATTDFVTEGLYLAFGKNTKCGPELAATFSADIQKMRDDGTIDRTFKKALRRYERTH